MQWIPVEAAEPDPFWGAAAASRIPRWSAAWFYPFPHPGLGVPLLWRNAASATRLGAILVGLGFFSVFIDQASMLTQLVLGAPVFEEFVKFGLALVVVGWLPRLRGSSAVPVVVVRMLAAWASGAAFGILEHEFSYGAEDPGLFLSRVLFHGVAAGLSMACYTILEPLPDVRTRWFATLPSSCCHYLVNASFPAQIAAALLFPNTDLAGVWAALVTALAAAATLVLPWLRHRARAVAQRLVAERLPALPPRLVPSPAQGPGPT